MDAFTAALAIKALDGLSTRAVVTAENIANAGTAHYRSLHVSFEQALAVAANRGDRSLQSVEPKIEAQTGPGDQGPRLDLELATASSTAMRYSALIDILGRELQIDSLAISGNA